MRAYPNCGNRDNTNSGGDVNTPASFARAAAVGRIPAVLATRGGWGQRWCKRRSVGRGRSVTAGGRGIGDA